MRRRLGGVILALVCILGPPRGWAQNREREQEPVRVKADSLNYDEQRNTVTATGDVVVTKGETTVTADTVGVNRTTSEVEARGNVVVKDPRGQIEAEALRLEMEDETGEITNGTVHLPRNQYIFNMSSKPLAVGLWRLVVKLNNGTTETIVIVLR